MQQPPNPFNNYPQQKKHPIGLWIGLGVTLLLFVIVAACNSLAGNSSTSTATSTATPPAQTSTQPTQAPTKPTANPTKQSASAVTHGIPHIGGPMSDFYGKYGQPNNQGIGNSETWIADQQRVVLVNASPNDSGEVTYVSATTSANWSNDQMKTYCSQFLPSDASEFNSISDLIDYHSSIGEVVMQIDAGSCTLSIAQP